MWEHHANLNDNDLKTFFEFNFPYSKGIIFSPKLCKKNNTGHCGPASHPEGSSNAPNGFMQRKL